jgi:hypothetical protein
MRAEVSTETLKQEGHGVRDFEHWEKTISVLGYSTQQS